MDYWQAQESNLIIHEAAKNAIDNLALIIKRSKEQKKNPYKQEIFTDAKDFQLAMARAEDK